MATSSHRSRGHVDYSPGVRILAAVALVALLVFGVFSVGIIATAVIAILVPIAVLVAMRRERRGAPPA
jgi:Flp pilus assembly protein TadB